MSFSKFRLLGAVASLGVSALASTVAGATVSLTLDAGYLRPSAADRTANKAINTSTGGGALLMLVDVGSGAVPNTALVAGSFTNSGEIILAVFGINASGFGGTKDTGADTVNVNNSAPFTTLGDNIEMRWFPSITLTAYNNAVSAGTSGSLLTTTTAYGAFNPKLYPAINGTTGTTPDGNDPWTIPASGGASQLVFATTDNTGNGAFAAGSQTPAEGYASFFPVPEPSAFSLIGGSLFGLISLRVWKRRKLGYASAA